MTISHQSLRGRTKTIHHRRSRLETVMDVMPYQNQAEGFVKRYLLADPCLPYTSVLTGIFLCKMVYDLTESFSSIHIKSYSALTKMKRIEWNNRRVGISTVHAIFISLMSLYFVFFSDLFSDQTSLQGLMVFRSSPLSNFGLGVSVGYFLADLGMIIWLYPSLGGVEYVSCRHKTAFVLSGVAVAYSLFSGEAQLYTYMVLISEVTTPSINLRWYLDTAGLKRSKAYLINGVAIFLAWLTARILLFIYMFYHVYIHYDQVVQMNTFGYLLVFVVPIALSVMNLMWFGKIVKGLKKTLEKRHAGKGGGHEQEVVVVSRGEVSSLRHRSRACPCHHRSRIRPGRHQWCRRWRQNRGRHREQRGKRGERRQQRY
ncbi:hypothetical protein YC2023_001200 [Brassica napus]